MVVLLKLELGYAIYITAILICLYSSMRLKYLPAIRGTEAETFGRRLRQSILEVGLLI